MYGNPESGAGAGDEAAAFRAEFPAWLEQSPTPAAAAAEGGGLEEADTFEILRDWYWTMADAGWGGTGMAV